MVVKIVIPIKSDEVAQPWRRRNQSATVRSNDEDDDVGDPVNSGVAADDNDEDAHQHLHSRSTVKVK